MIQAHGVGSRQDLPLPFEVAVAGAAAALVVSFALLAVLWREPRINGARAGVPLPPWAAASTIAIISSKPIGFASTSKIVPGRIFPDCRFIHLGSPSRPVR